MEPSEPENLSETIAPSDTATLSDLIIHYVQLHNSFSALADTLVTPANNILLSTPQPTLIEEDTEEVDPEPSLDMLRKLQGTSSTAPAGCSRIPASSLADKLLTPTPNKPSTRGKKPTTPKPKPFVMKKIAKVKMSSGKKGAVSSLTTGQENPLVSPATGTKTGVGARLRSSRSGPSTTPDKAICISDSESPDLHTPAVTDIATIADKNKEPTRSLRMQAKGDEDSIMSKAKKRKAGTGSSSSSGILLISRFPYSRLTIEQIVNIFSVYQIRLGNSVDDSHIIISSIRHMDRHHFEVVIQQLMNDSRNSQQMVTLKLEQLESVANSNLDTHLVDRSRTSPLRLQEIN